MLKQAERWLVRGWCLLALLCILAGVGIAGDAVVIFSDGRPSEKIAIIEKDGKPCLGVSQIARLLRLERVVDPSGGKATLKFQNHSVDVIVGGNVWVVDGAAVGVEDAAFAEGDDVVVTLASAEGVLGLAFGKTLRWDQDRQRLMVGLPAPNVIDIVVESEPERVTATIKTVGVLKYDLLPLADNKLQLTIKGGVFSKPLGFKAEGGLIEAIEARQDVDGVKLAVTLAAGPPGWRVYPQWNPDAIVVKVWTRVQGEIPEAEFKPPKQLAIKERFTREKPTLDVVVIDPGHGGTNRGSVGATGTLEKDINLQLARKLRQALEAQGMEVIMTRNDDISVPIETRTEIANSTGADLFISIHTNGFATKSAQGFEVYFLSPEVDEESRYVAATENATIEPASIISEANDEVAFILWDTAQNEFVAESSYLAQLVNEELARVLSIPNRGVKQAEFSVLKGAYLPGILLETAFITNPEEETMLKDPAFQDKVVGAVVAAISRFKQQYNR
ncbi:MAG TPA: N-acetylmuramoyl-L-alanine amidase [bacterium]|nr:N-acetylmuramoyl-L-alanine amidase [bacterium]